MRIIVLVSIGMLLVSGCDGGSAERSTSEDRTGAPALTVPERDPLSVEPYGPLAEVLEQGLLRQSDLPGSWRTMRSTASAVNVGDDCPEASSMTFRGYGQEAGTISVGQNVAIYDDAPCVLAFLRGAIEWGEEVGSIPRNTILPYDFGHETLAFESEDERFRLIIVLIRRGNLTTRLDYEIPLDREFVHIDLLLRRADQRLAELEEHLGGQPMR